MLVWCWTFIIPMTRLRKMLPLTTVGLVLHRLWLHALLAVLVQVASIWRFVLMSMFVRFGRLLNAINGGLWMTHLSLSQVWRIGKCLVAIPLSLEWYVVTSGMQSIDLPCEWDCSVSVVIDFSHLLDLGMDEWFLIALSHETRCQFISSLHEVFVSWANSSDP